MPGPKARIDPIKAVDAIVKTVNGASIRQVQHSSEISNRAARHIAKAAGMPVEELKAEVLKRVRSAWLKLAVKLDNEVDQLSISQATVPWAIMTQRIAELEGSNQVRPTTQVLVQINGDSKSKEQVIQGLFGNAVQSVSTEPIEQSKHINVSECVDVTSIQGSD